MCARADIAVSQHSVCANYRLQGLDAFAESAVFGCHSAPLSLSLCPVDFPADSGDAFDVPSPTDVLSSAGLPGSAEEDRQDQERREPPVPSGEDKREL